mmetsp:Transcript_21822/g.49407  ORF Transcript_21822/g.49407 Transcript_21822/m.49407 type:complete len:91 (-) Transcript_21822:369-641(-)
MKFCTLPKTDFLIHIILSGVVNKMQTSLKLSFWRSFGYKLLDFLKSSDDHLGHSGRIVKFSYFPHPHLSLLSRLSWVIKDLLQDALETLH